MGTDKLRIGTVAPLAAKLGRLELAFAEAVAPGHDSAEQPADRVLEAAIEWVVLERKTSGPEIGPVAELVREISVQAIALRVGQVPTASVAPMASVIALSHQDLVSVRVATPLVVVGLTGAPLALRVTAAVPAWEALDSAVVPVEEADVLLEARAAVAADVEDDKTLEKKDEIQLKR